MNNYDLLISRLDAFIRKYYANKLIRGALVFLTCLLFFILTVSVSEYFLYLPSWLRIAIATIFISGGLVTLIVWVVMPLVKMAKLGKVISHEQAARIIGTHFSEVDDKLLNILQLRQQHNGHASKELIEASIDQKSKQLTLVPILSAIDFGGNKKYLPYLLPVLLVGVFILVAAPNVFTDSSQRLLQPSKTFEKPAPFSFVLKNKDLRAVRNEDFQIIVTTEGEILPLDVSIEVDGDIVPMTTGGENEFRYTFRNVTEPVRMRFYAAGFYSKEYEIQVIQKPVLRSFKVNLDYPDYTGRKDEQVNSLSDMTVPAGTRVNWTFITEYTQDAVFMLGSNGKLQLEKKSSNGYSTQYRFLNDTSYTLVLKNKKEKVSDSFNYFVKVIPDEYPILQIEEYRDTVSGKQILLAGNAGDDYAISKLFFHYEILGKNNNKIRENKKSLSINTGALVTFQHYFDLATLDLTPGQQVNFYIEAWDNDGVNGSKATRSELMTYRMFDKDQLDSAMNANAEQINSGLSNSAQRSEQLQKEYNDMQNKLLQSDAMDWEQQESIQNMMKMQQSLQNELNAVKKRFEEQLQQSKQKEYSQNLKDKQDELKKQMDNVLNKELQEQMEKLRELMSKLNKQEAVNTMQQLEQDNKLLSMDMERMKELMKKLEMQMRLEDLATKMNELAEKELSLKDKTDAGKTPAGQLQNEQQQIQQQLEKAMQKDMKEIDELNKELRRPQEMGEAKELSDKAKQEMKNSEQQLQQDQKNNASQSQKKAADNLKQMSQSLSNSAGGMNINQIKKDIRAVRQILSNLMRLSFDQEQLMNELGDVNIASKTYVAKQREQKRLHDNSKMIRDSLFELSKDNFQLSASVNKETTELEKNMRASVHSIEERQVDRAMTRQQYVMTHTNNLALMLNEMLSNLLQMQSQAQQGQPGQCNSPGGQTPKQGNQGDPSEQLSDIITQQKDIGNAMQQMENAMNKRQGQGQKTGKDGQPQPSSKSENSSKSSEGEYGDAEQLARMAQQQAEIRKKLRELSSLLNSKGLGADARELQEIQDEMDRNETQLVNKQLGRELILRQQEILTRLLEAEKSVREQMQDDKRSSETASEINRPVPPELKQYIKDHKGLTEQYRTNPPSLRPYYKNMVNDYYKLLGI